MGGGGHNANQWNGVRVAVSAVSAVNAVSDPLTVSSPPHTAVQPALVTQFTSTGLHAVSTSAVVVAIAVILARLHKSDFNGVGT